MNGLKERLKTLLKEHNLTASAAEKKAGLFQGAIWNIISGRYENPNIKTIMALSELFHCPVDNLFFDRPTTNDLFPQYIDPKKFNIPLDQNLFNECRVAIREALGQREVLASIFLKLLLEAYFYFLGKKADPDPEFIQMIINKEFSK